MSSQKLWGLTEPEICVIYYRFSRFHDNITKSIEIASKLGELNNDITKDMPPELVANNELVANFSTSETFIVIKGIITKLKPVVEMIEEATPQVKKYM